MNCPRRLNEIGPWDHEETDKDSWREDNTCSFCGGLKPEIALEFVEKGNQITTTDKNYKIYINTPAKAIQKVYLQHFNEEQLLTIQKRISGV